MVSYIVRARVRQATVDDTSAIGNAPIGEFEPSALPTPITFRVRAREASRR